MENQNLRIIIILNFTIMIKVVYLYINDNMGIIVYFIQYYYDQVVYLLYLLFHDFMQISNQDLIYLDYS